MRRKGPVYLRNVYLETINSSESRNRIILRPFNNGRWPTDFSFTNSRFEPRAQKWPRSNGYRFENNGSFTVPGFPKMIGTSHGVGHESLYLSSCPQPQCLFAFVHGRVTKDDISSETYHGYPRPFQRIKSRVSKRGRETKNLPVVVNFMQILAFREFLSFHHRGSVRSQESRTNSGPQFGDTRSSPFFYEIRYPFIIFSSKRSILLRDK